MTTTTEAPIRREYKSGLTYQRTVKLENRHNRWHGDKTRWRRRQYKMRVDNISDQIGMTWFQRQETKRILDIIPHVGRLHSLKDSDCKVLAICYYYMWQDNPDRDDISFESSISQEYKLDERAYNRIIMNMDKQLTQKQEEKMVI